VLTENISQLKHFCYKFTTLTLRDNKNILSLSFGLDLLITNSDRRPNHADASRVRFPSLFVCLFVFPGDISKTDADRTARLDTQMFHDET